MNERMEYEIERTVEFLRPSMPARRERKNSVQLFKIAAGEISIGYQFLLLTAILVMALFVIKYISNPMIAVFCAAPLPAMLMFHKYIFNTGEAQRELEKTFKYAYSDVLSAKIMLLSFCMIAYLLIFAGCVAPVKGESFLRLALCGGVPSIFMCASVLLLSALFRGFDAVGEVSFCLWIFMICTVMHDRVNFALQECSTGIFALLFFVGCVLCALCYVLFIVRRKDYEAFV